MSRPRPAHPARTFLSHQIFKDLELGAVCDTSKMRIRLSLCTSVVLVAGFLVPRAEAQFGAARVVPAEDYHVELGAVFWTPSPEVLVSVGSLGVIGSEIDFVNDFGIEKKTFTEFRATLKPGRKHKIRFQYVPISYDGATILQRDIVFAGRVFSLNIPASAALDWKLWRFGYEWDFISRERGYVGLIGEVKYNDVKAEIGALGTVSIGEQRAPIPALGITGRGYIGRFVSITGEFTGFKLPESFNQEFVVEFWDFDLYGTVNIGRHVGVQGGYRSIDASYLVDQDIGQLNLKGLYLGGVVRF